MSIKKIVIDRLSAAAAEIAVNAIIEKTKIWRFYFDQTEVEQMKIKTSDLIKGLINDKGES